MRRLLSLSSPLPGVRGWPSFACVFSTCYGTRAPTTMTTRVQNSKISREFRLDSLACSRLSWVQSMFHERGWKPSGSVIVRRALSHYTDHLGELLASNGELLGDEALFEDEFLRIKAHRNNEDVPFLVATNFDGRSFAVVLREAREAHQYRRFDRVFGRDFRQDRPQTDWEGIWDRIDRGEKL